MPNTMRIAITISAFIPSFRIGCSSHFHPITTLILRRQLRGKAWFGIVRVHNNRDATAYAESPVDVAVIPIDHCDIIIANLNGITTDDGTAWEIGYAYAKGKHIVGIYTDWRLQFTHQTVNLMIECSLNKLVRSLDELRLYIKEYLAQR